MKRKNWLGCNKYISETDVYYILKYNKETFNTVSDFKFLDSKNEYFGESRLPFFKKRNRVSEEAIVPKSVSFYSEKKEFEINIQGININIENFIFDIEFDKPYDIINGEDVKNDNVCENYIENLGLFKCKIDNKEFLLSEELKKAVETSIDDALISFSVFEIWRYRLETDAIVERINKSFKKYPFRIKNGTLLHYNIKELNVFPQELNILFMPESGVTIKTKLNIKLENLRINLVIKLNSLDETNISKYQEFFISILTEGKKELSEWALGKFKFEQMIEDIPYHELTSSSSGSKTIIREVNNILKDYPLTLIENSVYIRFDNDKIVLPNDLISISIVENKFVNYQNVLFNKLQINFSIRIDTSDPNKIAVLYSKLNRIDSGISKWINENFSKVILDYVKKIDFKEIIEQSKNDDIKDFISNELSKFAIIIPASTAISINYDPLSDEELNNQGVNNDLLLKRVNYMIADINDDLKARTSNIEDNIKEKKKQALIEKNSIRTAQLEQETEYLKHFNEAKKDWNTERKKELKDKINELFLLDEAKKELINEKNITDVSFLEDITNNEQLVEKQKISKIGFSERDHFETISEISKQQSIDILKQQNSKIINDLIIEANKAKDHYNFDKDKRWNLLLNQSIEKDKQSNYLVLELIRFLIMLEYSDKNNEEKQKITGTVANIIGNSNLNVNEVIKIVQSEDLADSKIGEFIKTLLNKNHYNEYFSEVFDYSTNTEEESKSESNYKQSNQEAQKETKENESNSKTNNGKVM